ncbi:MAG: hypothetical protein HFI57_12905 [Lachnospiraceae bacterium]|nr:hypothetical protein [Lachnospiraceae bacterium]
MNLYLDLAGRYGIMVVGRRKGCRYKTKRGILKSGRQKVTGVFKSRTEKRKNG